LWLLIFSTSSWTETYCAEGYRTGFYCTGTSSSFSYSEWAILNWFKIGNPVKIFLLSGWIIWTCGVSYTFTLSEEYLILWLYSDGLINSTHYDSSIFCSLISLFKNSPYCNLFFSILNKGFWSIFLSRSSTFCYFCSDLILLFCCY